MIRLRQLAPIASLGAAGCIFSLDDPVPPPDGGTRLGFLYALGGFDAENQPRAEVFRAEVHADGTVGAWTTVAPMPAPRDGQASVASNDGGFIFVTGGEEADVTPTVQIARVSRSDGTLTWLPNGTEFATKRFHHAVVDIGSTLWLLGGVTTTHMPLDDVQTAPFDLETGRVGDWATKTEARPPMPPNRSAAVHVQSTIVLIGGLDDTGPQRTVQRGAVVDGTIPIWQQSADSTGLFTPRKGHCAATAEDGFVYVVGGQDDDGTNLASVETASFEALDTFSPSPSAFDVGREELGCAVLGGFLFIAGGVDPNGDRVGDAQVATIASGTVGPWRSAGAFPGGAVRGSLSLVGVRP